jgi:hypothetical protein
MNAGLTVSNSRRSEMTTTFLVAAPYAGSSGIDQYLLCRLRLRRTKKEI